MRQFNYVTFVLLCATQLIGMTGCTTKQDDSYMPPSPGSMEIHGFLDGGEVISSDWATADLILKQATSDNEENDRSKGKDLLTVGFGFRHYQKKPADEIQKTPDDPTYANKVMFFLAFEITPDEASRMNAMINGRHEWPDTRTTPQSDISPLFLVRWKDKDYESVGGHIDVTYDAGNLHGTFEVDLAEYRQGEYENRKDQYGEPRRVTGKFSSSSVRVSCMALRTSSEANPSGPSGGAVTSNGPEKPDGVGALIFASKQNNAFCKQYF